MITIQTNGTHINIIERQSGGWAISQGKSHLLLTVSEAHQLHDVLSELLTPFAGHGGEPVGPVICKPPILRYAGKQQ